MTLPSEPEAPHSRALARVVGPWGAVLLGLGSILGTGVFVSLGIAADVVGSWLVPAVVVAGLVAAANGLSSAQLAAAHPVSGGTYEYGYRFLRPVAGFTAGWTFLLAKSASAATAALGCATYVLHLIGGSPGRGARTTLAIGILLGVTALVAGGLRRSNRTNAVLVGATVAALVLFMAAVWSSEPGAEGVRPASSLLPDRAPDPASFLRGVALLFVAYTGYGRIATLGEEVREPERTIPRAIIATLLISMVLYAGVSASALRAVGARGFADATLNGSAPLEVIVASLDRPTVAILVGAGAVTAMTGVLLNLLLGLSRVLLAMARRGDMPRPLATVRGDASGPVRAVWVTGGLTVLLVLTGDVATTWSFSAFSVLIYYGLTNLAALRLPDHLRRFPRWIAWTGLVACVALAAYVEPAVVLAGSAVIGAGLLVRSAFRRDGAYG